MEFVKGMATLKTNAGITQKTKTTNGGVAAMGMAVPALNVAIGAPSIDVVAMTRNVATGNLNY